MKKYVIISLLVLAGVVFTSCEPREPQMRKKTIELVVKPNLWQFDNSANMYFCHFDVSELTANVYNYGEVSINREYNSGKSDAYQVALPETSYLIDYLDNGDETSSPYYYQQHIDYAYGVGFAEIFLTISDYYYEEYTPEAMLFRLQLTY